MFFLTVTRLQEPSRIILIQIICERTGGYMEVYGNVSVQNRGTGNILDHLPGEAKEGLLL